MIRREVIEFVFRSSGSPEEAADKIERYELIRSRAIERSRKIAMMKSQTEKDIQRMLDEKFCDHDVRKTHGDPAGGSDSHEECLICGQEISCTHKEIRFT